MWQEWVISALLVVGGGFCLLGSLGIVKMPDFYMRLHGPTKATTLGMACILAAAALYFSSYGDGWSVKELLISVFLLLTAPITGYILIKAALHHRLPASEQTQGRSILNQPKSEKRH